MWSGSASAPSSRTGSSSELANTTFPPPPRRNDASASVVLALGGATGEKVETRMLLSAADVPRVVCPLPGIQRPAEVDDPVPVSDAPAGPDGYTPVRPVADTHRCV